MVTPLSSSLSPLTASGGVVREPAPSGGESSEAKPSLRHTAARICDTASENGYYEPQTDMIVVDASRGTVWQTLAHEATHQLLFNSAFREKNLSGEVPPWLNEGLAEYMVGCATRAHVATRIAGRSIGARARTMAARGVRRMMMSITSSISGTTTVVGFDSSASANKTTMRKK